MLSCHKVAVLQMMTTSRPTISLVGKLKAESGGELTKVKPQENVSLIFQPGIPPHPAQGTCSNWRYFINHLHLLLSIFSPTSAAWGLPTQGVDTVAGGFSGLLLVCPCQMQDPEGLNENKRCWLTTYQLCDLGTIS